MNPSGGFFGILHTGRSKYPAPIKLASLQFRETSSGPVVGGAWCMPGCTTDWLHVGAISVAFHGEIFNAGDLCRQLGLPNDTPLLRLLLAGWQRWQAGLLPRLDGLFALAVRDGDDLALYRDPSGLCGLYRYHDGQGDVAFATDLDILLRLPGTRRRLAQRSLHEYLRFSEVTPPNTLFENVMAVAAGQVRHWPERDGGAPSRPDTGLEVLPARFSDAVDLLDVHLQRSVRSRLADCSAPAAFLSGGIDSALLCAMVQRQRQDATAVTVGFDLPDYDESPVAQRIAARLGMKHEVLRFSRTDYLLAFERFSARAEQPMADPASLATLLASEHCTGYYDIAIDGTGADEAVGMMPPRHVRLAVRSAALLPDGARRGLARMMHAAPGLAGFAPIVDFEHPADMMTRWHGFTRLEIEALCDERVSFADTHFYRTFHRFENTGPFSLYSAMVDAMPGDRLSQAMRISGLRMRFPFFEPQVDRFLRSLPVNYRYTPAEPKRILRTLLARYLPPDLWAGPKQGFNFPLHEFLTGDDFLLVRRYVDNPNSGLSGVLPHSRVQHHARQFMAGNSKLTFRIWALVVLSAWLEHHGNPN